MNLREFKQRAADAGVSWGDVRGRYDALREQERLSIERTLETRRIAFQALGAGGHGGRWKFANRHATGEGDATNVRAFDDVARELAATEIQELGAADPSAALWELVTADAPEMPAAAETMERALQAAIIDAPAPPVSPDDLLPLPLAAHAADVSEQWLRILVKAGKIQGFRVGRCWLVRRQSVESFKRHPTAGRPRREAAPF